MTENKEYVKELKEAIRNGDIERVKDSLKNSDLVNTIYDFEETPLHIAIRYDQFEIVKLLIDNGADVEAEEERGWTPLMCATIYGRPEISNFLIDRGAHDFDRNIIYIKDPLACSYENRDWVAFLYRIKNPRKQNNQ